MTGVMYCIAIRQASYVVAKASEGLRMARTGSGHSPLRPYSTCIRSDCSVLVGRPVEGPPRWTSMITKGNSVITARPIASDFSAMPGPDVPVTPSWLPKLAPMDAQTAAISSSAWNVRMPYSL
jgi:hypothetical protein